MAYFTSILAALYCSCFSIPEIQEEPQTIEFEYYSSKLCQGDKLHFENKAVQFKKVVSDSRCPKEVTCVRAGNVKVLVEFYEDGKSLGTDIIIGHDFDLSDKLNGMEINLSSFEVTPYPTTDYKIQPEDYTVNMKLRVKMKKD